jgi:hypothetical protein
MYISLIIYHVMLHHSGLQLQRLCSAVIGDLVRSPVLLPTLETSGSLRDFITKAVAAVATTSNSSSSNDTPQYPLEPVLRALTAIATDHPPSRVALLAAFSGSSSSDGSVPTVGRPLAALFSLALHPYPPAAAAAG